MKKFISLVLILVLLASLSAAVFAEGEEEVTLEEVGITFHLPDAFRNTVGALTQYGTNAGDGIYFTPLLYAAMPKDEYRNLMNKYERTEEEDKTVDNVSHYYAYMVGLDGKKSFSELNEIFGGDLKEENTKTVYQTDDLTYFLYVDPEENASFAASLEEPYASEFKAILGALDKLVENAEFYEPVNLYSDIIGKQFSFQTTDLDGNPVTSEDLFGDNLITVVNMWASWCPERIQQLAELEAISSRLPAKNCGLVGLLLDANEAGAVATAKQLMSSKNATFPVVLPPSDFDEFITIESFPVTIFVDKEGKILSMPIVGASADQYEATVDTLLLTLEK